jgi:hypothetical protein
VTLEAKESIKMLTTISDVLLNKKEMNMQYRIFLAKLKTNLNSQIDMFVEEFIKFEGISHLMDLATMLEGNILVRTI